MERCSAFSEVDWYKPVGRLPLVAQLIKALAKSQPKEGIIHAGSTPEGVLHCIATSIPIFQEKVAIGYRSEDLDGKLLFVLWFREQVPSGLETQVQRLPGLEKWFVDIPPRVCLG